MSEQIKKYTKRPVTVEAMQFTDITKDAVWRWASSIQMNVHPGRDNGNPCLRIPTKEGEMTCSLGDWLIREPFPTEDRKLYPCKPDIFEQTYQPAPEQSEQNDKLTSEGPSIYELAEQVHFAFEAHNDRLATMEHHYYDKFVRIANLMQGHAAQQVEHATAGLRHECEQLERLLTTANGATKYQKDKADVLRKELKELNKKYRREVGLCELYKARAAEAQKELERMGKNRDRHFERADKLGQEIDRINTNNEKITSALHQRVDILKTQLSEAQRQRDEAVKFLSSIDCTSLSDEFYFQIDAFLIRLSSAETKPTGEMPSRYEQDCHTRGICPECNQNLPPKDEQP